MRLSLIYELDSKMNQPMATEPGGDDEGEDIDSSSVENLYSDYKERAESVGLDSTDDIDAIYQEHQKQMDKIKQQRMDLKNKLDKITQQQSKLGDTIQHIQKDHANFEI
jgi:CII-binding regulator of phage lambda lysogenization HflD